MLLLVCGYDSITAIVCRHQMTNVMFQAKTTLQILESHSTYYKQIITITQTN